MVRKIILILSSFVQKLFSFFCYQGQLGTPKVICTLDVNSNITVVSGSRAGLANRIRSLIALKALGFKDVKITKEKFPDQHNSGEKDLNELFTNVQVHNNKNRYDYVYRSFVLPSITPAKNDKIDRSNFNKLNFMGLIKPETLNSASNLKQNFKMHFKELGLKQHDEQMLNLEIQKSLGIHIRQWEGTSVDSKLFSLGDECEYGARLCEREISTEDNSSYLIKRIEKDIQKYSLEKVFIYSDSKESLKLFENTGFSHLITSPEIVAEGWSQALNEIISLSRHKVIYAYPMSTFSHMSCLLADDETVIRSVY